MAVITPPKIKGKNVVRSAKSEQEAEKHIGYSVKVHGEFRAVSSDGRGKVLHGYNVTVRIPELEDMNMIQGVVKNHLLVKALSKKYNIFKGDVGSIRTHYIDDVTPLGAAGSVPLSNVQVLAHPQLLEFIKKEGLKIDVSLYSQVQNLRDAIELAMSDPNKFSEQQDGLRASVSFNKELAELNPELEDNESVLA